MNQCFRRQVNESTTRFDRVSDHCAHPTEAHRLIGRCVDLLDVIAVFNRRDHGPHRPVFHHENSLRPTDRFHGAVVSDPTMCFAKPSRHRVELDPARRARAFTKGLVRPHESSRFAGDTETVTTTSNSMNRCGSHPVIDRVMPAPVPFRATLVPRGYGAASRSRESSTENSASQVTLSYDAHSCVDLARVLANPRGLIIVDDRRKVPIRDYSKDGRTRAIDGYLVRDCGARGERMRNGRSGIGPPPRNRRWRSEYVDRVQRRDPAPFSFTTPAIPFGRSVASLHLTRKEWLVSSKAHFRTENHAHLRGSRQTNVHEVMHVETSHDFHENSSQFVRRFMTTNAPVRTPRKASQ